MHHHTSQYLNPSILHINPPYQYLLTTLIQPYNQIYPLRKTTVWSPDHIKRISYLPNTNPTTPTQTPHHPLTTTSPSFGCHHYTHYCFCYCSRSSITVITINIINIKFFVVIIGTTTITPNITALVVIIASSSPLNSKNSPMSSFCCLCHLFLPVLKKIFQKSLQKKKIKKYPITSPTSTATTPLYKYVVYVII